MLEIPRRKSMLVSDNITGLRRAVAEVDFTKAAVELSNRLRSTWSFTGVIEMTVTVRGKGVYSDGNDLNDLSATSTLTIPINHG